MKALNLILVFLVVLSCGGRTKQLYKKGTEIKTEQTVVDTKKESEDSSKESTKKEEENSTIYVEDDTYEVTVEPTVTDTFDSADKVVEPTKKSAETKKLKIKSFNGKETEIEYPNNSKINVKFGTSKKDESKVSKKEQQEKEKVNKNTESNVQNKNNSTKKESEKNLNVERKEPIAFNIVFPIALFAMLGLILFLVLKRFKILK